MKAASLLSVLLLTATACRSEAPAGTLPATNRFAAAVEWLRPSEWARPAGELVLGSLAEAGEDFLRLESAPLQGQQNGFAFSAPPLQLELTLVALEFLPRPAGWEARLRLEVSDPCGSLEFSDGQESFSCQYMLSVPVQDCPVTILPGEETLVVQAGSGCSGEAITLALEPYCRIPLQTELLDQIRILIGETLQLGSLRFGEQVAAALAGALGLLLRPSLALAANAEHGGRLQLWLEPQAHRSELDDGGSRVVFQGGFWSEAAPNCLFSDPGDLPGKPLEPVDASEVWGTQGPEASLALVVSDDLLQQALRAVFRAGCMCRTPGAGPITQAVLTEKFPSLAFWQPQAEHFLMQAEAPRPLETLIDSQQPELWLKTSWPRVHFDFYFDCFGAWCRALSVETELALEFRVSLTGGLLSARLADMALSGLQVTFSGPLREEGEPLRQAAMETVEAVVADLLGEPFSLPLDLPAGCRRVASLKRLERQTIFYLVP